MASYLTALHLCKEFARGVHSQYCYTLLQLRYLPVLLIMTKGVQIGYHQIPIVNFSGNTTTFLIDIDTWFNKIKVFLKLYEEAWCSTINFSKVELYGQEHIKKELSNQDKCNSQKFSLRYLELILVSLSSTTPIGTK